MATAQTDRWEQAELDERDDWLGDESELDWFEEGAPAPRPREAARRIAAPGFGRAGQDPVLKRRLVAIAALVAVAIVAVVVALVAFGGGGSKPTSPLSPPVSTTSPPAGTTGQTGQTTTSTPSTPTKPALHVVLPTSGKLQQGDTGDAVKTLQQALTRLGAGTLTADGNFGAATQQAVQTFQKSRGLTADGIVGAKTAKVINTALAAG